MRREYHPQETQRSAQPEIEKNGRDGNSGNLVLSEKRTLKLRDTLLIGRTSVVLSRFELPTSNIKRVLSLRRNNKSGLLAPFEQGEVLQNTNQIQHVRNKSMAADRS